MSRWSVTTHASAKEHVMTTAIPTLDKVFSVRQVAEHLDVQPNTVYMLISAGALRAIRVGRLLRVPQRALEEYLAGGADAE